MNKYLISIITPSFNSISCINETYNSIRSQTYENWEWIITDDCSNDGTYEYLIDLSCLDSRVKVFRNKVNSGAAISRNNSLNEASGDFIAFIDSDDLWILETINSNDLYDKEWSQLFIYSL